MEFWEVTSVRYIGVLVELRFCCLRPTWGIRACFLRCLCEVAGWARGVYAVFFCMIGYSYYPKGHILVLCVSWDMYSEWSAWYMSNDGVFDNWLHYCNASWGMPFLRFFYDYFSNDIIMGCCRLDPAWQNLRCVWFVLKLRSLMFTWQAMIHSMLFTWPLSCACFMVLIIKFAGLIRWVSFKKIWVFVVSVALLSLNTIFEVPIGPTCGSSIVACSLLFWS